jgi:cytoskeletal protein RodZ
VSEAATEYVEAKAASSKRLPLLIGAAAAVLVLAVVGIIALVVFNSSDAETGTQTNTPSTTNTAKALTASPSPAASHDASERTVEVSVSDGKADVYHGDEKVGTTPFAVRGKLGEHVTLTLKRDGYSDEPVDFVVGEKKAFMYTLAKK